MNKQIRIEDIKFNTPDEKGSFFHSIELSCFHDDGLAWINGKDLDITEFTIIKKNGNYQIKNIKGTVIQK